MIFGGYFMKKKENEVLFERTKMQKEIVLERLKEQGYRFGSLDELCQ